MALKKIRQDLRNYFLTGRRPNENEFANLIESNVNILDDKANDADINTGTSDDKFVTVLGAKKTARKSITVNNIAPTATGDIQITTITGNAATATKLQTSKNINGVAFDGSANITLPAITTITGNAATATKLAAPKNINGIPFDGSTNITIPVPSTPRIIRMPATVALSSVATVQNTFSTINLLANKTYFFRGKYLLGNGTNTHTTAIGWSGTAVVTSMEYVAKIFSSILNTAVAVQSVVQVSGQAMKVLNATSTAATTTIEFEGIIRTAAAGTLLSQIQFGAIPGGINAIKAGSFIELNEIGSDTLDSIG